MDRSLLHPSPRPWTADEAYAWCRRLASSHYENFPVASRLLPRNVRPHIAAVYAFARIADDIADEPGMAPDERLNLLDGWEQQLEGAWEGTPRHPVFVALRDTVSRIPLPPSLFTDLLSAFRQDVTVHRYATFDDLLDYCRRSANPVGRLVLLISGYRDEALFGASDDVCTALQLTNFWQDLRTDLGRGRLYLPQDECRRFGCDEQSLLAGRPAGSFRELLALQVSRTRELFRRGSTLPGAMKQPLRAELRLTIQGGLRILEKIERSQYTVLEDRPRLTAADGPRLFWRSLFA